MDFYVYARYAMIASAVYSPRASVVCLSVLHKSVFYQNEYNVGLDYDNNAILYIAQGQGLHQCAKFRQNCSNRSRDMVFFWIFQDGDRCHLGLGFSKFRIFNGRTRHECPPS